MIQMFITSFIILFHRPTHMQSTAKLNRVVLAKRLWGKWYGEKRVKELGIGGWGWGGGGGGGGYCGAKRLSVKIEAKQLEGK